MADPARDDLALPPARVTGDPERRAHLAREVVELALVIVLAVGAIVWIPFLEIESETTIWLVQAAIAIAGVTIAIWRPQTRRWLRAITIDQWRAIDAETVRDSRTSPHVVTLVVLLACALSLTIQEYVGGADKFERWFPYDGEHYWELMGFVWWTAWRVIGYVVIPVGVILCLRGERVRDYYISPRGFFKHLWIYGAMFVAFSPIVIVASISPSFRETYPFYRMANRSYTDLIAWEALYIIQFAALEFFFRGFLLHALRRVLGANAIFVMMVPYCMIHFGKPMAETIGAIGAGLVLGTLAMRTRSIWGGVMIHVGVATSMDILALQGCPPIGSDEYCHP